MKHRVGDSHLSHPAPSSALLCPRAQAVSTSQSTPELLLLLMLHPQHGTALSSPRDEQLPRNSYKTQGDGLHPHIQHLRTTSGQAAILMASGAQGPGPGVRTWRGELPPWRAGSRCPRQWSGSVEHLMVPALSAPTYATAGVHTALAHAPELQGRGLAAGSQHSETARNQECPALTKRPAPQGHRVPCPCYGQTTRSCPEPSPVSPLQRAPDTATKLLLVIAGPRPCATACPARRTET